MTALVITLALFLVAWFLTEHARRAVDRWTWPTPEELRFPEYERAFTDRIITDNELLDLFHSCERGDRPPGGTYSAFGSLTARPEDEEGDRAEQDS